MIKLTRLTIVRQLSPTTPLCVVVEIAKAHGIILDATRFNDLGYISSIIWTITNTECPSVALEPKTSSDLRLIARFINSDSSCVWTRVEALKQAWRFILTYMTDNNVPLPSSLKIGQQTQDAPTQCNACILYRLCQQSKLNTNYLMSIQEMAAAIQYSMLTSDQLINNLTLSVQQRMLNRPAVIDALVAYQQMPMNKIDGELTFEGLNKAAQKFKGDLYLAINPSTREEAIYLSAFYFGIDLSAADNPFLEYEIVRNTLDLSQYVPVDIGMLQINKRNPRLFKLDFTFNPRLPESFYPKARLASLFNMEGFLPSEIALGYYPCLQTAYLSETFYHGFHEGLTDSQTSLELTEISEVPSKELILYGIRDNSLKAYTSKELADYFEHTLSFVAPSGKTVISKEARRKLKNIASLINSPASTRLLSTIKMIENNGRQADGPENLLFTAYSIATKDVKSIMIDSLYRLLELAMYMRGWIGKHAYPIASAPGPGQGTTPVQEIIDMNVTQALARFEQATDQLDKPSLIYTLPLYKLVDNTYQPVMDGSAQQTIRQRIEIVKAQGADVAACIRLTSNVFAVTAHKYLSALSQDPKFNLSHLVLVS